MAMNIVDRIDDAVRVKQTVAIVVAMKMENEVRSALDGVVTAIHVEEGEQVTGGQPLLEIEETPGDAAEA